LEGELDNTSPGKVTGWMLFAGLPAKVTFDLDGDFHRDIRGTLIRLQGPAQTQPPAAAEYMEGLSLHQTGKVGDITAGLPPQDYVSYPYIEWYGEENGRVVIELEPGSVSIIPPVAGPHSKSTGPANDGALLDQLPESLTIDSINPRRSAPGTWVSGTIHDLAFEALVFSEHATNADWELHDSCISKLCLRHKDGCIAFHWDRGLNVDTDDPAIQDVIEFLCAGLAQHIKILMPDSQ
jgi:hypothetical protein